MHVYTYTAEKKNNHSHNFPITSFLLKSNNLQDKKALNGRYLKSIAKGTTDPRVEFILPK